MAIVSDEMKRRATDAALVMAGQFVPGVGGWETFDDSNFAEVGSVVVCNGVRYVVREKHGKAMRMEVMPAKCQAPRLPRAGEVWRDGPVALHVMSVSDEVVRYKTDAPGEKPGPGAYKGPGFYKMEIRDWQERGLTPPVADAWAGLTAAVDYEIAKAILPPADYEPIPYVSVRYGGRADDSSSSCARCGGPVLLVTCARTGGCRTVDERIGEPSVSECKMRGDDCADLRGYARGASHVVGGMERVYGARGMGITAYHPIRETAVALWREQALVAERQS